MSEMMLALEWWARVVLPVVVGLSLVGAIILLCARRASWRFQSWVFLGVLVAFALVLVGPWYPQPAAKIALPAVDVVNLTGSSQETSVVPRNESVSLAKLLPLLGGVWGLGVIVSLLRLGSSQWALRKLAGKSALLADVSLETTFGKEIRDLLEEKKIEVLQTEADVSPCCLGWIQRKVLFPMLMLERLNRAERDLVLRHEILHLTSGDVLLLYFQRLMEALYWWNPIVAKISESLSEAREGVCDEALVDSGTERQTYASVLVQLGELSSRRLSSAVPGSPGYKCLKLRLERILGGRCPSRRVTWCGGVIAFGVCASSILAVVVVGQGVPKPTSIAAKRQELDLADFPKLDLVGIVGNGRLALFDKGYVLAVGETIDVGAAAPGLSARLSFLGVFDGKIRLRWSSTKGVLEQEIEMAPEVFPVVPGRLDPGVRPGRRPMIYDTPPVRPEDPLKEVDGDPSVAEQRPKDRGGLVDGRGFRIVGVNLIEKESFKKIFKAHSDAKSASAVESIAEEWPVPDDSVVQTWMGTDPWGPIYSEVPALLDRRNGKSTPGNGWFRLEDTSPLPNHRRAKPSRERAYYDDAEFSRRHVEQGLNELHQQVPGQLQHEVPER